MLLHQSFPLNVIITRIFQKILIFLDIEGFKESQVYLAAYSNTLFLNKSHSIQRSTPHFKKFQLIDTVLLLLVAECKWVAQDLPRICGTSPFSFYQTMEKLFKNLTSK